MNRDLPEAIQADTDRLIRELAEIRAQDEARGRRSENQPTPFAWTLNDLAVSVIFVGFVAAFFGGYFG